MIIALLFLKHNFFLSILVLNNIYNMTLFQNFLKLFIKHYENN